MVIIGGYAIDAAPVEDHALDSALTAHPVEDGADAGSRGGLPGRSVVVGTARRPHATDHTR